MHGTSPFMRGTSFSETPSSELGKKKYPLFARFLLPIHSPPRAHVSVFSPPVSGILLRSLSFSSNGSAFFSCQSAFFIRA